MKIQPVHPELSQSTDFFRTREHCKRAGCPVGAVATWTITPISWLKSQFSKEMWVRLLPGLGVLCIVCSSCMA